MNRNRHYTNGMESVRIVPAKLRVIFFYGLALLFAVGVSGCAGIGGSNEKMRSMYAEIETVDLRKVRDGEYVGQFNENFNSARVSVSVKNGTLLEIEILKQAHGPGYGAEKLAEEIVEKQRLDADCVAGATKSSYVLKQAVVNALKQGL